MASPTIEGNTVETIGPSQKTCGVALFSVQPQSSNPGFVQADILRNTILAGDANSSIGICLGDSTRGYEYHFANIHQNTIRAGGSFSSSGTVFGSAGIYLRGRYNTYSNSAGANIFNNFIRGGSRTYGNTSGISSERGTGKLFGNTIDAGSSTGSGSQSAGIHIKDHSTYPSVSPPGMWSNLIFQGTNSGANASYGLNVTNASVTTGCSYNLFYVSSTFLDYAIPASGMSVCAPGAAFQNTSATSHFADPANLDFHVISSFSWKDSGAGTNISGGLLTGYADGETYPIPDMRDLDNECRPSNTSGCPAASGGANSIGADEWVDTDGDGIPDYLESP